MNKSIAVLIFVALVFGLSFYLRNEGANLISRNSLTSLSKLVPEGGPEMEPHPLSIQSLKEGEYPGSEMLIEQTLNPGINYSRYVASYRSEGLKIYGLLTIPYGDLPTNRGWPTIIFNHGYISPSLYKTTEKYVAYQDAFARNGYVTFKSDYRGHGNSEGEARGGYGTNDYTIDVMNAIASLKRLTDPVNSSSSNLVVDSEKIGMWGHSMGGHITLESMVVSSDIKAGVIWAGVVGSYQDLFERWRRRSSALPTGNARRNWREELANAFGDPYANPEFWNSLSATSYLSDISGPVQLHHGTADSSVPLEFSTLLEQRLQEVRKGVELYTYEGDDHNISKNLSIALNRSVEFFDMYLK